VKTEKIFLLFEIFRFAEGLSSLLKREGYLQVASAASEMKKKKPKEK
jgi:hypothetical protein